MSSKMHTSIQIFIEDPFGTTFELNLDPSSRIRDVKQKIKEQNGVPVDMQSLVFASRNFIIYFMLLP